MSDLFDERPAPRERGSGHMYHDKCDTNDEKHRAEAASPSALDACDRIVNNGMGEPTECGHSLPCEYHDTEAASPAALDVERLGLSDEQTRNLRQHLIARQQTLGEWISDVLFEFRMGRPDGIEYPPAACLAQQDGTEETRA